MSFAGVIQRIHLWAGLALAIQILLWMASGVVMTWFHLDLVRGERNAFSSPPPELVTTSYASPGGVIAQTDGATRVELRSLLGRPVYEVSFYGGEALFDAMTGEAISPISEETARQVAKTDFIGDGELKTIALLEDPPKEYRGSAPVWRADFDDRQNTRIYVSTQTGEIIARRNDVWRLYDFFWMLHIMDYGGRDNFNNPLVKGMSAAGLLFALSGVVMLFMKTGRQQLASDIARVFGRVDGQRDTRKDAKVRKP